MNDRTSGGQELAGMGRTITGKEMQMQTRTEKRSEREIQRTQSMRRTKRAVVAAAAVTLTGGLLGCAQEVDFDESCAMVLDLAPKSEAAPLVVITDVTGSVNRLGVSATFEEAVRNAALEGRDFVVIAVDGNGARAAAKGRLSDDSDPRSDTRKHQANAMPQCLQPRLAQWAAPTEAGTDLHSAFELVTSTVQLGQGDTVLVSSDGLSNAGRWVLDAASTAEEDPAAIAQAWAQGAPIDLGGARLVWDGLADSTQVPISRISWMRDLARSLCYLMNGNGCEEITTPEYTGSRDPDLPEGDDPVVEFAVPEVVSTADTCTIDIPAAVMFTAGRADLNDGASETLAQWVPVIQSAARTTITGHTAAVPHLSSEDLVDFSLKRALAVKSAFTSLGVPDELLHVVGAGDTQRVVEDILPNGRQDTLKAGANRRVTIEIEGATTCPAN